ncbi:WbqC family protein [Massilia sp. MB5]|uniref:WbqC family protein n=1 Tax=Massilia sp. MB5 TaxID=2919578 RepID=UPI0021A959D0|nr:WbqC family protein [Massilia sp. MB5]
MKGAYRHAPYFASTAGLLDSIAGDPQENLFGFLHQALLKTCAHLDIHTPLRVSSSVPIDHALKGQDKVLAICQAVGATSYINAIGGTELYSRDQFAARGLQLQFLRSCPFEYPQFGAPFVPWLSIADVMMFNPVGAVRERVMTHYELI